MYRTFCLLWGRDFIHKLKTYFNINLAGLVASKSLCNLSLANNVYATIIIAINTSSFLAFLPILCLSIVIYDWLAGNSDLGTTKSSLGWAYNLLKSISVLFWSATSVATMFLMLVSRSWKLSLTFFGKGNCFSFWTVVVKPDCLR